MDRLLTIRQSVAFIVVRTAATASARSPGAAVGVCASAVTRSWPATES